MDNPFQSSSVLSFCPGILGLERGLERAIGPISVVAYVEIEAFIIANLIAGMEAGILAPAPVWTNVKTFDASPFRGKIHGIIGGYPCQPFSTAGKRQGEDDPRHLWPDICRAIKAGRPLWCLFENVAGHITLGYDQVYRDLRDLGYAVESGLFTAAEAGAPHERKRLFILAVDESSRELLYRNGFRWPGRITEYTDPGGIMEHATSPGFSQPGSAGERQFSAQDGNRLDNRSQLTGEFSYLNEQLAHTNGDGQPGCASQATRQDDPQRRTECAEELRPGGTGSAASGLSEDKAGTAELADAKGKRNKRRPGKIRGKERGQDRQLLSESDHAGEQLANACGESRKLPAAAGWFENSQAAGSSGGSKLGNTLREGFSPEWSKGGEQEGFGQPGAELGNASGQPGQQATERRLDVEWDLFYEAGWNEGADRSQPPGEHEHHAGELADTDSGGHRSTARPGEAEGQETEGAEHRQGRNEIFGQRLRDGAGNSGAGMADTESGGMEGDGSRGQSVSPASPGSFVPGRDGRIYGWPARPGQPQWDWEHPRVTTKEVERGMGISIDGYNFREDLLRALGNSVVEQQAEIAIHYLLSKHFPQNGYPLY